MSKWNKLLWKPGHVNNELQAYTDRDTNIYLDDGKSVKSAVTIWKPIKYVKSLKAKDGILTQVEAADIKAEVSSVMEAQKTEIVNAAVAQVESKYVSEAPPSVPMPSALSGLQQNQPQTR